MQASEERYGEEEACVELNQYSYIIQRFITTLIFLPPTVHNLVSHSKRRNNSVTHLFTLYKSQTTPPYFLVTTQSAPHPRGHTPISQNGSIGPVYILFKPSVYSWYANGFTASRCSKLGLSGAYTLLISLSVSQVIPASLYL